MNSLLQQLKKRRLALGLKQNDMLLRMGISRQQYQRLESRGNPTLGTLELIAKGFNCELMLVPREKLAAVQVMIESGNSEPSQSQPGQSHENPDESLPDNPWHDLLGDES
jgi:transcriptional regulator with XRE-family HTH domain